jgi:hypothetical protein
LAKLNHKDRIAEYAKRFSGRNPNDARSEEDLGKDEYFKRNRSRLECPHHEMEKITMRGFAVTMIIVTLPV